MKMLLDELHYDIDDDYGFFCVLDDEPPIADSMNRNEHKENSRRVDYKNNHIVFRFRMAVLNTLLLLGTCVSSIIICYNYINYVHK